MDINNIIGITSGVLSFLAYVIYIVSIFKGGTRPNRVTWWILSLIGFMVVFSYYAVGARETIWIAISYAVGPLVAAILSIKYGEGGWTKFDRVCLAGALISFIVWILTDEPLTALLINIGIDVFGILPTVKKSYLDPASESKLAWTTEAIASILSLFAVASWTFEISIYPIYLSVFNVLITLLLIIKWRPFLKDRNTHRI